MEKGLPNTRQRNKPYPVPQLANQPTSQPEPLRQTQTAIGKCVSMVVGDVTVESDVTIAVEQADRRAPLKVAVLGAGVGAGA